MPPDSSYKSFFDSATLSHLATCFSTLETDYNRVLLSYTSLKFTNPKTHEHASHGFARRLKTLKRSIENIWAICPPEQSRKLTSDELTDLEINLQGFVFNTYGCFDNLAWIWVIEKNHSSLKKHEIGFFSHKLVRLFPDDFQTYVKNLDPWFKHLKSYRDALAHRIPLYVPPLGLSKIEEAEYKRLETAKIEALKSYRWEDFEKLTSVQDKLGKFTPLMMHSYNEEAPSVIFHVQVITDWMTEVQFSEKFLLEL